MAENEGFRLHEWGGPLHWERWQLADPGPTEVQVEVEACGVGLTVLNNSRGENWDDPTLLPRVPGHELVGRVVKTGAQVKSRAIGDRVLAYFYLSCFACRACTSGREERCQSSQGRLGIHRDGGYARLTNIPAGNAVPLADGIDAIAATTIPDAVATSLHVCQSRLALKEGERLIVIGAGGGVGAHLVQVARTCGAEVAGVDRSPDKLALIEQLGAVALDAAGFGGTRIDPWDGPVDAVVDLVGTTESLTWGLDQLGQGGRLCVVTTFRDVALPVGPRDLVVRELVCMGSHYATRLEVDEAAGLVASGLVRPVIGTTVAAQEVETLHEQLRAGLLLGRGAISWTA